jgi:hypothetical protein
MKAKIIDTHHTVQIENIQIDLFYNFNDGMLEVYIDGNYFVRSRFNPSRQILSYTNVLDVSVTYYDHYCKYIKQKNSNELD